jgi:hypothetical protein
MTRESSAPAGVTPSPIFERPLQSRPVRRMQILRAKMSRRTRVEVYALLRKAEQQLEHAQRVHKQLTELMTQVEKDARSATKATKRKTQK